MEEIAQADAVHIHALWEEVQYQAICISRLQRKPYIVRPCGLLDPWSMAQNRIKKRLYLELRLRRHLNAASALHFTTPLEEERARPLRLHAPTVIEPNGVDLKLFRNCLTPGSFRERLDIPNDAPLVLFLGRLHPKKGLDLLIPAFAKAAPANAVLAIAGEGDPSYEDSLRREVVSCGLKNRAKFVGFLDGHERIAAFFDATLFVLPSYSENFAIAVIESLAAGTPVIVSDQVNIHPDIEAAKVGGVTPAKLEDLSNEIHTWLNDTAKREQAIIRAHEFVASYDMSEIAARWLHHYRDLSQGADNAAA